MTSKKLFKKSSLLIATFLSVGAVADDLPAAASRSYAQNYKDMALASCIATAYQRDKDISLDASFTANALNEWGRYDIDENTGKIEKITKEFLKRSYQSHHGSNVQLELLKCIDLYHSDELEQLVKQHVLTPKSSFLKDHPSAN